ncbi:integrase/recombinase xerD homolog [Mercenaria mercenaria]|uniref:integrase/recombinase xerD homolog n=1 Tax=Mercenaria mercenaria TaxID=6596 RepID=UPI00234EDF80|nr:integrase/recombinase xerD homolog [Mercenaria mercenaria]
MNEDDTSSQRRDEQIQRSEIVEELKDFFNSKFNDLKKTVQTDSEWTAEATRKKCMFKSHRWLEVEEMCDILPSNQDLFSEVKDAVTSSKEQSTLRNYKYSKWCSQFGFSYLPASPVTLALYLVSLIQLEDKPCGKSKLNLAFYSVNNMHELACLESPCKDKWLKLCLEGCLRKVSRPIEKKEPISPEILKQLVLKFASENCSLGNLRIVTLCVLSSAGFLRISEAFNLKRSDIELFDSYCSLYIEKSKTDVYRDGQHVVIAKTGNFSCPVSLLERYLHSARIPEHSTEHIFRPMQAGKHCRDCGLRTPLNKPLSYTRTREIFKDMLTAIGIDASRYGLHSFRSGAATVSANLNTTDRLWKRHGRWKNVSAKDGYVKDSIKKRLSVSLNLEL